MPACPARLSAVPSRGSASSSRTWIRRSRPASGGACMAEAARVLVIGATSAIAQAVARTYARRGARLVLVGRDASKLEAVRADLVARGAAQADVKVAELSRVEAHPDLVDAAAAALGGIDVALVAHGVLPDQARSQ